MRRHNEEQSQIVQFVINDTPSISGRHARFEPLSCTNPADKFGRVATTWAELQGLSRVQGGKHTAPVFEISESCCTGKGPGVGKLLFRRPIAVLALIPKPAVLFTAGAVAGAIGTGSWLGLKLICLLQPKAIRPSPSRDISLVDGWRGRRCSTNSISSWRKGSRIKFFFQFHNLKN